MSLSRTLRTIGPLLGLLLWPENAAGKVASPPNCVVPPVLTLVGRDDQGMPDALGEFTVTIRDIANLPIVGSVVFVDFSQCGDARVCSDQQPTGNAMCSYHWVVASQPADMNGVAHLRVVGYSDHAGTPSFGATGRVYSDGVWVGQVRVAAYDHDGNGVGPSDLSLWLADYFATTHPARADYDGDGTVGPADLSLWMAAFFATGSVSGGAAAPCP